MHAKPLLLLRLTGNNSEKKVRQLHIVGKPQRTCNQHTPKKKSLQLYIHTNRGPQYEEEKQVI